MELQQKAIKNSIVMGGFTITDFSKWVHKGLLSPLNTVRSLNMILGHEKAKEVFLARGAKAALKLLDTGPVQDLNAYSIEQLTKALYNKITQLQYEEIREMRRDTEAEKVRNLLDLKDAVIDICDDIIKEV
jgi:hypothetical protein